MKKDDTYDIEHIVTAACVVRRSSDRDMIWYLPNEHFTKRACGVAVLKFLGVC